MVNRKTELYNELKGLGVEVNYRNATIDSLTNLKQEYERNIRVEHDERPNINDQINQIENHGVIDYRRDQLTDVINNIGEHDDKRIFIKYGNKSFPLLTIQAVRPLIFNNIGEDVFTPSEQEAYDAMQEAYDFSVDVYSNDYVRNAYAGNFFKYFNNTSIPLEKYAIYNKFNIENYNHNCLYIALKNRINIKDFDYTQIKNGNISFKGLQKIVNDSKFNITVYYKKNNEQNKKVIKNKNNEYKEIINIGLVDSHYFIIDETKYTRFAVNHYNEIKHIKDWHKIIKIIKCNDKVKYKKSNKHNITSYTLITLLFEKYKNTENNENLFTKINFNDMLQIPYYISQIDEDYPLTIIKNNIRETDNKKIKSLEINNKVFFDFETTTDGPFHNPFMVSFQFNEEPIRTIVGRNCALKFLDFLYSKLRYNLKQTTILYAHNLVYDLTYLIPHMQIINTIKKGNRFLNMKAMFMKKITLIFKDTLSIIPMKLATFGQCFNLEQSKEIMPYKYYSTNLINSNSLYGSIGEACDELNSVNEKRIFIKNILDLKINEKFDLRGFPLQFNYIKYANYYCEKDIEVLKNGYVKFREWCLNDFEIDIDNVLTIPTLAKRILINKDCFKDVNEIAGNTQNFIMRTIVGGRVMTNSNKIYKCEIPLNDFDAVSLYPSAMAREEFGFLQGSPKELLEEQLNIEFLNKCDGYFVEIEIMKVNRARQFPLLSYINDKTGVRDWCNKVGITHVNKFSLEDLIKYQKIEFKIKRGYYYNEGRNNTICEEIKNLFNLRKKYKNEKNPIEVIYKLVMNAAYGKMIQKPIKTDYKIFNTDVKLRKYITRNYNKVKVLNYGENQRTFVEVYKDILKSFNHAHIGSEILSLSKRIMCEVMDIAEDHNIKMIYTDTDSIHIEDSRINELATLYKKKFNRELIGKDLGQFHTDFNDFKIKHPVSVESWFLAKKIYIDKLISSFNLKQYYFNKWFKLDIKTRIQFLEYTRLDKEINKIGYPLQYDNIIEEDLHIRMKGIPAECVVYEDYEKLYNGENVVFDLAKNKVIFELSKDLRYKTKTEFKRKLEIKENEKVKLII